MKKTTVTAVTLFATLALLAYAGPGGPGSTDQTQPLSVCTYVTETGYTSTCVYSAGSCSGSCAKFEYERATCPFNLLSSCSTRTNQTVFAYRWVSGCVVSPSGPVCMCGTNWTYVGACSVAGVTICL